MARIYAKLKCINESKFLNGSLEIILSFEKNPLMAVMQWPVVALNEFHEHRRPFVFKGGAQN